MLSNTYFFVHINGALLFVMAGMILFCVIWFSLPRWASSSLDVLYEWLKYHFPRATPCKSCTAIKFYPKKRLAGNFHEGYHIIFL